MTESWITYPTPPMAQHFAPTIGRAMARHSVTLMADYNHMVDIRMDGDRKDDGSKDGDDDRDGGGIDTALRTKPKNKTQRPSMYKVLLLNDDYTPMEFVIHVLERFFGITSQQAVDLMLTVHRRGVAVVGVFSFEIAETKVTQVMDYARQNDHPLQCTMEKE